MCVYVFVSVCVCVFTHTLSRKIERCLVHATSVAVASRDIKTDRLKLQSGIWPVSCTVI